MNVTRVAPLRRALLRRLTVWGLFIALGLAISPGAGYSVRHEVTPIVQPGLGDDDQPGKEGDDDEPLATVASPPASYNRGVVDHDSYAQRPIQDVLLRIRNGFLRIWVLLRR